MKLKATKVETAKRVEVCLNLLLSGASLSFIRQSMAETYQISERQVERHIAECRKIMDAAFRRSADEKINEYVAKLQFLYERAVMLNNIAEARRIIMDLITINGSIPSALTKPDAPITPAQILNLVDLK